MPRKGAKTKFDEEVVNLSKLLRNEHGEGGVLVSQHEFWVDFRASPGTRKAPKKAIFTFNLPSSTPAMIMIALANIVQVATSRGLDPFRISYPWAGQRCCFLRVRAVRAQQELRRAQEAELLAIAARTYFLSSNVEEFGYYGFLELFENRSRDHLIWMGGEAAKHSPGAKEAEGSPPEDVATLLSKDRVRYDRVLERALDPTAIDEDGYSSIPELLEQASLIDPTRKPHLRLSNRALARIKLDLSDRPPPVPSWWATVPADPGRLCLPIGLFVPWSGRRLGFRRRRRRVHGGCTDSPVHASGSQGVENDVEELSHYGLTEDSEESGGEGGGVVGKSGKCKSGGHLLGGDSGGSGKSGRNKSSGGTVGADKPSDGGKAGGGDSDGDKSASPSTEPPASIALEDKPPAPKGGVNLTGTNWASKSGSAEKLRIATTSGRTGSRPYSGKKGESPSASS
ncbi:hypothetical protein PR001_g5169 [Phytophthora rubi]|uniref:Uncharacterized protein n=1 Tax=Phytophthora rubi TaxID=129364 RepID=A0A6A3NUL8_9STRA|nr:hypothetical protein PR001_g5169 [Phytophthora rubi]